MGPATWTLAGKSEIIDVSDCAFYVLICRLCCTFVRYTTSWTIYGSITRPKIKNFDRQFGMLLRQLAETQAQLKISCMRQ